MWLYTHTHTHTHTDNLENNKNKICERDIYANASNCDAKIKLKTGRSKDAQPHTIQIQEYFKIKKCSTNKCNSNIYRIKKSNNVGADASVRPQKEKEKNNRAGRRGRRPLQMAEYNLGITLIALIITIIVLLILAGVTLNIVIGENGIINKANVASENTKYKSAYEELRLKILEIKTINNGNANLIDIAEGLNEDNQYTYLIKFSQSALLDEKGEVNSSNVNNEEIKTKLGKATEIYVEYKGYTFKINNNLIIEEKNPNIETSSYTIEYDLQGGEGEFKKQTKMQGESIEINKNSPTRNGYEFQGWATSENGEVEYSAGDIYDKDSDITLYAIWKHVHSAPETGILISGTDLSDNAEYSASGGCYTKAVTYEERCGSTSYTPISVSGYTTMNGYYCGTCGSGNLVGGGNITIKCNSCGAERSGTIPSQHVWCRNAYIHIGAINGNVGTHSGFSVVNLAGIVDCNNTITKTKYICSCGIQTDDSK